MIGTGRSGVAAGLLLAALSAGCSGGSSPDAGATDEPIGTAVTAPPSTEPAPTETPSAAASEVDVTVVPDEITPAYVDAVANTLYGILGDVTAEVLAQPADASNDLTRDQLDRLAAVLDGEEYVARIETVRLYARENVEREGLLPPDAFEGLRFETVKILEAHGSCIVAVGYLNRAGTEPSGGRDDVLTALSLSPRRGTGISNPTPWIAVDQVLNLDPDGQENPDEVMLQADLADFGDVLVHSCEE